MLVSARRLHDLKAAPEGVEIEVIEPVERTAKVPQASVSPCRRMNQRHYFVSRRRPISRAASLSARSKDANCRRSFPGTVSSDSAAARCTLS